MKTLFSLLCMLLCAYYVNAQSELLTGKQVVTFHHNAMTTGRRNSPLPQMMCVGAFCNPAYTPVSAQCHNMGHDGQDVNWKCEASVDSQYRLGTTTVICEGYDYPDDPFVLVGSCSLEYSLEYNGNHRSPPVTTTTTTTHHVVVPTAVYDGADFLVLIACFIALCVIFALCGCCDSTYVPGRYSYGYPIPFFGGYPSTRVFSTTTSTTSGGGSSYSAPTVSTSFGTTRRR
jgi:hypothetical protein